MEDRPKSLKHKAEQLARKRLLNQEHITPLTCFVDEVAQKHPDKDIPYFDPLDGGIRAQCLFVLEAPGPKAVESGFVSRNNNDESAKNFFEINVEAGIPRKKTITWNIVPWYIGTGKKLRKANIDDINQGLPYLHSIIDLLPDLKIVVLVGGNARRVKKELKSRYAGIKIFECYHPSPLVINTNPRNRQKIIQALKPVSDIVD
jgi:uracil-DNA glycosylase